MRGRAAALVLCLCAIAGPARAQDAMEAEFFDRWARRLYAKGKPREALRLFLRAQRAAPSSRGLFNIGVVAEVAKEPELAYAFYEEYLASGDDDPKRRARAASRRDALGARFGRVRVLSRPPGAEIWVGRRELGARGRAPRTLALEPGPHVLELELEDHHPARREIEIARGELQEVQVDLQPRTGRLEITTDPPGGQVLVLSDRGTWTATAGQPLALPVGNYRLRYAPLDRVPASAQVRISPEATERRHLASPARTTARGTLLVNARAGELWVDGVRRAATPARLRLPPGPHRVEIRGARRWSTEVEIRPDEVLLVTPQL